MPEEDQDAHVFTAQDAREAYMDDPWITNEEYGRLVEEADLADQHREWQEEGVALYD